MSRLVVLGRLGELGRTVNRHNSLIFARDANTELAVLGCRFYAAEVMLDTIDLPPSFDPVTGRFGEFGGRFVGETLIPALEELTQAFIAAWADEAYHAELDGLLADYVGRATPLYHARRLSEHVGLTVWLKREDLAHTGAHKINNTLGQVLLAERMGKRRIIAETGAGQHGVATATACALRGLECEIFMGARDIERQAPNVQRMRLLGAKVHAVHNGSATLKDAMNEAMRDWVTHIDATYYCVGSAAGPHPYPYMVRELQAVIGRETRRQFLKKQGKIPDAVIAAVGGGSNAIGIFSAFLSDRSRLFGVEAAGKGLDTEQHAATLTLGRVGVLHGARSLVLQNDDGQIKEAHSISAGLDYPGVGPEHAFLKNSGRVAYLTVTDAEALKAFHVLTRLEGILPALESSHALAALHQCATKLERDAHVIVCLSGRGDKDLETVLSAMEEGLS